MEFKGKINDIKQKASKPGILSAFFNAELVLIYSEIIRSSLTGCIHKILTQSRGVLPPPEAGGAEKRHFFNIK